MVVFNTPHEPEDEQEQLDLIALYFLTYGSLTAFSQLISRLGPSRAFRQYSPELLASMGLKRGHQNNQQQTLSQTLHRAQRNAEKTLEWLAGRDAHLLTPAHISYPESLRHIPDPPPVLFVQGTLSALSLPSLSIVGSRAPTRAGLRSARMLSQGLSRLGLVIVSGLARGIDTEAHAGAMQAEGATVAVLGTGIDKMYPRGQDKLREQIQEKGALLSEFPLGSPPLAHHFPRRNRLVTGLSSGTLIVEAALRSGSMISARLAADQGREVFAVPGSIHSELSAGTHVLIQQGAKLVHSINDIVDELPALPLSFEGSNDAPVAMISARGSMGSTTLDANESRVLALMSEAPVDFDELVLQSALTAQRLSTTLVQLELKKLIFRDRTGYMLEPGHQLR